MRLFAPLKLHSAVPSSVRLWSIDAEVSNTTRMFGRSDCARALPVAKTSSAPMGRASLANRDRGPPPRYGGNIPVRQHRNPTEGSRTGTEGAGVDASHWRPGARVTGGVTELSTKLAMS